jgi:1,4-alpha-glucan branching enzyme
MSLKKQYLKSKPECKVTFTLPKEAIAKAKKVTLVGEFNDWNKSITAMKKLKNGSVSVSLNLKTGREYQYRYLIDGKTWENDWAADKYVASSIPGVENSVVVV